MQWNVKRVMTWTPVQVGGEYSPVAALVKPHSTLSSVHMLNVNPPMHNPSGHLPHTFYIAHLQGLKILKYEINPNPNPNPHTNPNPNPNPHTNPHSPYCVMRFIVGYRVYVP